MGDLDPARMPSLAWLLRHGAVGMMNTRTAAFRASFREWGDKDPSRGSAMLTLGAGTRAAVGPNGAEAFTRDEPTGEGPAEVVYRRRNGAPPEASAFQLNPLALAETQAELNYRVETGALGTALRAAGIATAVLGDADRPGEPHREAVLAAMDGLGRVDAAAFNLSTPNPLAPYGRETSLPRLEAALAATWPLARFIAVDWGDTARLDDARAAMLPAAAATADQRSRNRLDALFALLLRRMNFSRDTLILLSPYPSRAARSAWDTLTPVILMGSGTRGLLFSPTTRRLGVVANVDIAPTVTALFGMAPLSSAVVGRPLTSRPDPRAWERLSALRSRLMEVEAERRSVLRDVVSGLTWAMGLFALLLWLGRGTAARWVPLTALLVPATLPFTLTALAFVQWPSASAFTGALWLSVLGVAGLAASCARLRGRPMDALGVVAALTAIILIADGMRGFPHMPYSILSYSLIEGARYYGVGNETMGAFLAAVTLAGTAFFTSRRLGIGGWQIVIGLFALSLVMLAGPSYGAKFGGAVAGAAGFFLCVHSLMGRRFRLQTMLWIAMAIVTVIAAMIMADRLRGGGGSHVARAFAAIQERGLSELGAIIERKATMNFRLLLFSPWSRLMALGLLATFAGLQSRRRRGLSAFPIEPVGAGILGALAAAAVAFLVDDAGVLAAATALIYLPVALAVGEHSIQETVAPSLNPHGDTE